MALSVLKFQAPTGSGGSSVAFTLPSAPTAGNLLVAFVSYGQFGAVRTVAPPSGWTAIDAATFGTYDSLAGFYRVAQAGDSASQTFIINPTNNTDWVSGVIWEITGANSTTPINAHTVAGSDASANDFVAASAVPSVLGCLALAACTIDAGAGNVATSSAGWTDNSASDTNHTTYSAVRDALTADTTTAISNTFSSDNAYPGLVMLLLIAPAGGGGSSFTKSISETYSLSDSLRRLTGRTLSDTASLGDSASRLTGKRVSDSVTASDSSSRLTGKGISDSVTASDSAARVTGKGVSDSLSVSDLFASIKTKLLALLDSLGVTDSLIRAPRKIVAESLTVSDSSVSKGLARGLVDALSIGDALSAIRARLLALADSLGLSDAFTRSTGKNVADSIGISDAFVRAWSRILSLADSISVSDTVTAIRARLLALSESLGLTDALSRSTGKRVADSIGLSDAFSRAWSRILGLTDSIAVSDTVQAIRARLLALSESLGLSDSLGRSTGKRVADSIGLSDTFARAWNRVLSLADSITTTDVFLWFRTSVSSKPAVKSYIVQAWNRLWSVASAARTWIATEMTIHADIKRPTSIEDFMLDWSAAIGQDGIISSAWTIPAGLTAVTQSATGTTATVRLSGGVASRIYTVTNTVTLASGQVKVQDILIPCA